MCRRRGPCASDQKRMRCVHQAAGTVFQAAQYTIVSSSFARARPKPLFSVTDRFYFPPRSTPRSSWLLPFRTGKCTRVHVDTARNKRKPFCTFEETGAVSEVHGQITFSILRQACVRTSERNICTLNLFFSFWIYTFQIYDNFAN